MDWGARQKLVVVALLACQLVAHTLRIQAAVLFPLTGLVPCLHSATGARAIGLATIFPPSALATDDAAAISAIATCVQWSYRKRQAGVRDLESHPRRSNPQMQIVGLLPAVGKQSLGGGWDPVEWQGRSLPGRGNPMAFGVRLVQPNLYGVYSHLIMTRHVELWKQEQTLKDGRTVTLYELRPVSFWRRFLNNLV
ncbi:hypothetical protein Esti_005199 [Eimeria stiedai]